MSLIHTDYAYLSRKSNIVYGHYNDGGVVEIVRLLQNFPDIENLTNQQVFYLDLYADKFPEHCIFFKNKQLTLF